MMAMADVARLVLYGGVLVVCGTCGAEWFARDGVASLPSTAGPDATRAVDAQTRTTMLGWLLILVALLMMLSAQFVALELSPTRTDLAMLLRQTTWGAGWSAIAASSLCGALATAVRAALPIRMMLLIALAASMSGVGHAAADNLPLLARALDTAHVLCIGTWIGTLLCIGRDATPRTWERFSRAAVFVAPLAVLTGVGGAFRRIGAADFGAIVASDYARLLAGKIALVLIILAIGARHRSQVKQRGVPTATSVRVELVLATVVLMVTAVLTGTAPPGD